MNSYTNILTITTLMMTESTPASMRSSIIGVSAFFRVSAVISMALGSFMFKLMPIGDVWCEYLERQGLSDDWLEEIENFETEVIEKRK